MPYQSSGGRKNNLQIGVGRSIWGGDPPPPIPERVLDGIPGCTAWVALLFCVTSAVAFPRVVLTIAALLGLYSALRFLLAGIANLMGQRRIAEWERIDWREKYATDAPPDAIPWEAVHHIVLIPNYKEPDAILRKTLDSLANQCDAATRITVVLAMEASEPGSDAKAERLCHDYRARFANIFYTVHPAGLPGETRGKSSNECWAARWAKRKLVDERGYNIDHIVISTMDADTMWHKNHFAALTYLFATDPQRYLRVWQAPIRHHGNVWDISPLLRIINAYASAFELAYLAARWWMPMTMSSYALSLRLMHSVGYWDTDAMAEDWRMYLKAFFNANGEVKIVPVFLPFHATAVFGDNLFESIANRYQQSLRHAWGSKEMGFIIARMLTRPEIDIRRSLRVLVRVSHDILLSGAGWIIVTVGSQLPILLNPGIVPPFPDIFRDPVFVMLSVAGALVVILGVVFWYQDVRVRPPRPADRPQTLGERLMTLISFPALPVLTLLMVALPVLQAQTLMLIGSTLEYRVARKL